MSDKSKMYLFATFEVVSALLFVFTCVLAIIRDMNPLNIAFMALLTMILDVLRRNSKKAMDERGR